MIDTKPNYRRCFFDAGQKWELFDAVGKTVPTGEGKEISLKNLSNGVY